MIYHRTKETDRQTDKNTDRQKTDKERENRYSDKSYNYIHIYEGRCLTSAAI